MTEGMSLSSINHPTINMNNAEVANNPNDKASGEEYFDRRSQNNQEQEQFRQTPFVDRSAQLRATMNSLAALNAASIIKSKKLKKKSNQISENSEIETPEKTDEHAIIQEEQESSQPDDKDIENLY